MEQLEIRPVYSPVTFNPVHFVVTKAIPSGLSGEELMEAVKNSVTLFKGTEEECKQFIENRE